MGIAKRLCAENKVEIRKLKAKIKKASMLGFKYPEMSMNRRMNLTILINELTERIAYLRMNKLNSQSPKWDFTIVFKKDAVRNRTR